MQIIISISMTVNEKLLIFVDTIGQSQRQFTSECGLSEGALRAGKSIGADKLGKIKRKHPEFNLNWLLFDEPEMFVNDSLTGKGVAEPGVNYSIKGKELGFDALIISILKDVEKLQCDMDALKLLHKIDVELEKTEKKKSVK